MGLLDDGGSGKGKILLDARQRGTLLAAVFWLGVCAGVVAAERLYIAANRQDILSGQSAMGGAPRSAPSSSAKAAAAVAEAASAAAAAAAASAGAGAGGAALSRAALAAADAAAIAELSSEAAARDPELKALREYLESIAPDREVLVGVSNKNPMLEGMLDTWLEGVKQAKVANYVVVALDEETVAGMKERGVNVFYMPLVVSKAQADTGDNHSISALKFGILRKFITVGWAVLLSDIDVAVLQNPFDHLHRDHDVEGQSDGFDAPGAYGAIDGVDDPSMGWARFAQKTAHFNMNSGLFYLKANPRCLELVARLEARLAKEKYWDQTAYNEEMFFLSHGDRYRSPQVTVRVMDIHEFMNSKTLFKFVRNLPLDQQPPTPVMVHINYHPDKHERMKAVMAYYLKGDKLALGRFPGGSEPGS